MHIRWIAAGAAILMATTLMSGCGKSSAGDSATPTGTTATTATTTAATGKNTLTAIEAQLISDRFVRALQEYKDKQELSYAMGTSCDAGHYLDGYTLVVCATDDATLEKYQQVLDPLLPEDDLFPWVRYEKRAYSLKQLNDLMTRLEQAKDLEAEAVSVSLQKNRVVVTVADQSLEDAVLQAAGDETAMVEVQIGTVHDAA